MKFLHNIFFILVSLACNTETTAQRIGVGTSTPQAALDITSSNDGLLPPRLTTMQRDSIENPKEGLMIYNITLHCLQAYTQYGWKCTNESTGESLAKYLIYDNAYTNLTTICSTLDNGVIVGGHFEQFAKLIKLNSKGQKQWTYQEAASNTYLQGLELIINKAISLSDGSVIAVGVNRQTSAGYIVKLNSSGVLQWRKELTDAYMTSVTEMPDGNVIVCGYATTRAGNHGATDIWLAKFEIYAGNIVWEKSIGGSFEEQAFDIVCLNNNTNFAIVGSTTSSDGDFIGKVNHGARDAFVMKCFGSGSIFYSTVIGGSMVDILTSIAAVNDNEFVVAGRTNSNDGDVSITNPNAFSSTWMLKLTSGTIDWQKKAAFYYNSTDQSVSVQKGTDGNFFVLSTVMTDRFAFAYEKSDLYLQKISPAGVELLNTIIGGSDIDEALAACILPNGKLIIAGRTWCDNFYLSPTPLPSSDKKHVLFKINNDGAAIGFTY